MLLADAPADLINTLVELTGPDADTPLLSIELRHLGGALAREVPGGGAQPTIDAAYLIYVAGVAPTPEVGDTVRTHARAVKDALTRWRADYDYYNFLESPADADAALPHGSARRLREIKAIYDPDQAIISAHPVRPVGD